MAHDGGSKYEEEPVFKPEGEAPGHITLDQAQDLALQHAQDHRDFHGHRFADQDLTWSVLSQEEGRDSYDIRLAYRPSTGFRGKPGIQHFTIDRTGAIRFRSVLQRPVDGWPLHLLGIVAGAIVIVGAVVGGLFAAGVFPDRFEILPGDSSEAPLSSAGVSLAPETASRLVSPQGDVTVDLEAGSVSEAEQLLYQPLSPEMAPQLPPGYAAGSKVFDLSIAGAEGDAGASFAFMKPITITVLLSSGDLSIAGGNEATVVIQHYHDSGRVGPASDHGGLRSLYRHGAGGPVEHLRPDHQGRCSGSGSNFDPHSDRRPGRHSGRCSGADSAACAFPCPGNDAPAGTRGNGHATTAIRLDPHAGAGPGAHSITGDDARQCPYIYLYTCACTRA
jgi:hypothetical protein